MKSILNSLRKIDLFGKLYIFEENDNQKFTTVLGTVLTVFIIITCIVIGFLFGKEVYQRKNPTVLNSEEKIENSRIGISEYPFLFAFVNGPSVNQPKVPDYFSMQLTHISFDSKSTPTIKYYGGYKKCSVSDFSELYQPYIKLIYDSAGSMYDFYCIKYSEDLYFENNYSTASSSYLNVRFLKCDETKGECGDDLSVRENLISDLYMIVTYIDSYIDSSSYKNPKNYYPVNDSIKVSEGLLQRRFFNVQKINFIDNKGWMLDDKVKEEVLSVKAISKDVSKAYNNNLVWVTISSPNIRSKIERSYMKMQDTLAKIGGFFNALFIIVTILTKSYVDFSFYKYIYSYFSYIKNNEYNSVNNKLHRNQTIDNVVVKLAYSNLRNSFQDKSLICNKSIIDDVKLNNDNLEKLRKETINNSILNNINNPITPFNPDRNNNQNNDNCNNEVEKQNSKINYNNYVAEPKPQDNINKNMINSNINDYIKNKNNDNSVNNSKIQLKVKEINESTAVKKIGINNNSSYNNNNLNHDKLTINPETIDSIKNYTENMSYLKYLCYDIIFCRNNFRYQRKAVSKIISFDNILEVSYKHFIKHELDHSINSPQ